MMGKSLYPLMLRLSLIRPNKLRSRAWMIGESCQREGGGYSLNCIGAYQFVQLVMNVGILSLEGTMSGGEKDVTL
jgi:hypothetical protein